MHRVNRSAPWKEQARGGLAPDFSLRKCQKGGSGRLSFDPLCVFSVQLRTALLDELGPLDEIGEHLLEELRGRVADRFRAVREDALAYVRLVEVSDDLCAQPREYRGGKFCRRRDAVPAGNLEPRQRFGSVDQGRFLDVVEPSLELADEREIFRTARHRQRSMRCLPEP